MPVHWEPVTFEVFCRALQERRCEVVIHKWTRDWARTQGWNLWGFRFRQQFIKRLRASEQDFWVAYKGGAFNLHMCERQDMWGR